MFLIPELVAAGRTRDAIRTISKLGVEERHKKSLLGEWFQLHPRAAGNRGARARAYNELLGRARNARLMG